jgi:protein-tyrosine-phosphatase
MAEALLRRALTERAVPAEVTSAGFVTEDRSAEPHAVRVMADRGLDIGGHRSRLLTPDLLAGVDLVLGMTREHVRRACTLDRDTLARTFTLKELVRRGTATGPAPGDVEAWVGRLAAGRNPTELLGDHERDDVADPMGRSLRRFQACADEIEAESVALATLVRAGDDP